MFESSIRKNLTSANAGILSRQFLYLAVGDKCSTLGLPFCRRQVKYRATDQTLGGGAFHSSKLCRILRPHNLKFGGVGFEMETTFNSFVKEVNLLLEVCRKFRISPFYI